MARQICVFTVFSLLPRNFLILKCCLIHLNKWATYCRIGNQIQKVTSQPPSGDRRQTTIYAQGSSKTSKVAGLPHDRACFDAELHCPFGVVRTGQ